jgi:hypothetical protein
MTVLLNGMDELAHAATYKSFVQTSVWQSTSLEIDVGETGALNRYFDESSGDMRFEAQGYLVVLAASALTLGPSGTAGVFRTLGNLYLSYEYEFFEAALDDLVSIRATSEITCTATATVGAVQEGTVVAMHVTTPIAGYAGGAIVGSLPMGFSSYESLLSWMFVGTVLHSDATSTNWWANTDFRMLDDDTRHRLLPGVGVVGRFVWGRAVQDMKFFLFADIASATSDAAVDGGNNGILQWSSGAIAPVGTSTLSLFGQWVPLE